MRSRLHSVPACLSPSGTIRPLLINTFDNCFFRSCDFLQLPPPSGANDSVARQTRRRSKRRDSLSAEQEKFPESGGDALLVFVFRKVSVKHSSLIFILPTCKILQLFTRPVLGFHSSVFSRVFFRVESFLQKSIRFFRNDIPKPKLHRGCCVRF